MFANYTPSRQLLKEVRAYLVLNDSPLSQLAAEMGLKRQNLTKALTGDWQGQKAAKVVDEIQRTLAKGGCN